VFLSEQDIRDRLAKGDLGIDPRPDENQIGSFAIDLCLGTQFLHPSVTESHPQTIAIGDSLSVAPGASVLAVTLEYVYLPLDLAGFLFPKSSWERVGLSLTPGTIDPGFRGKLTLVLHNTGLIPVLLHPGLRIVRLCLAHLSRPPTDAYMARFVPVEAEIASLKAKLSPATAQDAPTTATLNQSFSLRLSEALSAKGAVKGKALEESMEELFNSVPGLRIIKRNARLKAEELDLVIKNDLTTGFWRVAGSPLIVECKNWSGRVGAREISILIDKLHSLGPDAKAAILVSPNGVTGDSASDAVLKIREARQRGLYVIVLDCFDLEALVKGVPLAEVIECKYEAILLI
jgi:deoxycytidine triphosphate deaminase